MPELPEVESLRRGLERRLRGRVIKSVLVRKPKLVSGKGNKRKASAKKASEFVKRLAGERVAGVERIAKNLIFRMRSGAVVVAHLKMSGQFAYRTEHKGSKRGDEVIGGHPIEISEHELPNKHTHIIFKLDQACLYYNDTRMFGYLLWYSDIEAAHAEHFKHLGAEPLSQAFTLQYFRQALSKSAAKLKAVLMDQKVVTGLGNIYVDEVCFAAGVRPDRKANTLTAAEIGKIYTAIKAILKRAILAGGSSVSTYRLLDLTRGNYAREHKVYGRAGKPCFDCGRLLAKTLIQSRTTVFCKKCQK